MNDNSTNNDLENVIRRYGLEQQVASVRAAMLQKPAAKKGILRMLSRGGLRIAASIVIILAAAFFYLYSQSGSEKLYNNLYETYSMTATRGEAEPSAIATAYNQGNLQETIQLFQQQSSHTAEDYFLAGNAWLQLGDPRQAGSSFLALMDYNRQSHTFSYQDAAEYYLALSYLKLGNSKNARPLLEKIHASPAHSYHDKVSSWFLLKLRLAH